MTQVPPPSVQRCFSTSATQEKGEMTSVPLRVEVSVGGGEAGMHVATVKTSTSLRMKNRGKVPPRLETLEMTSCLKDWLGKVEKGKNIRCE